MPVPSLITDLSDTASVNFPQDSDSTGSTVASLPRAIQAILKKQFIRGVDITVLASGAVTMPSENSYFVINGSGFSVSGFSANYNGRIVTVEFTGALTLTHSASFIMPGAASITTAAGDVLTFVNESGSIWRCINILRGSSAYALQSSQASYALLASPSFTGTPIAPTAAFDTNTTQIATTAYVRNNGKAFAGTVGYAVTTTLTASDFNKAIRIQGATVTITLPAVSAGIAGDTINLTNVSSALSNTIVTVQRAGADVIYTNSGTGAPVTSLKLLAGDSLTLVIDSGAWTRIDTSVECRIKAKATLTKTVTGTLDASDLGKTLFANSASAITLTLPAANINAGECINVTNINTGVVTIQRAGTDTINARGVAAGTSFTLGQGETTTLTMDGTSAWYEAARGANQMTLGSNVATTSGTSIDFTGIPAWAKRITLMLNGVSTSGTSNWLVQIGNTTFTTTGYTSQSIAVQSAAVSGTGATSTTGFVINSSITSAANAYSGQIMLTNITGTTWIASGVIVDTSSIRAPIASGVLALGAVLDRVRLTSVTPDTFDAGSATLMWEG